MKKQIEALIEGEKDVIANLANISAFLNMSLENINWVGFYLYKDDHLVLGPFQGKPACIHLYPGKGVCSYALENKKTTIVEDVHAFPGHIACDADSRSELVVPIYVKGKPWGVLDIDAPTINRFTEDDGKTMTDVVEVLVSHLESNHHD